MKICMVISTLAAGGAERVMCNMANFWVAQDYDITLITLAPFGQDFYLLDP
jgi:hypothetical protein